LIERVKKTVVTNGWLRGFTLSPSSTFGRPRPKLYDVILFRRGFIGFRTIGTVVLLNGKPTFLRGISRMKKLNRGGRASARRTPRPYWDGLASWAAISSA
jgi:hypothetical protein